MKNRREFVKTCVVGATTLALVGCLPKQETHDLKKVNFKSVTESNYDIHRIIQEAMLLDYSLVFVEDKENCRCKINHNGTTNEYFCPIIYRNDCYVSLRVGLDSFEECIIKQEREDNIKLHKYMLVNENHDVGFFAHSEAPYDFEFLGEIIVDRVLT